MRLNKLKITNFASIRGTHLIDFDKLTDKKVLITGECQIIEGADSNGSGKTSIFDALSWCLFNRTPKKLDVDEVVNDFEHYCEVQLLLTRGSDAFTILRKRFKGDESDLEYWINNDHRRGRTLAQTQEMLLAEMGIAQENKDYFNDFLNSTYISTETIEVFASKSMSNKARLNLISRFLHLEVLEIARDNAQKKVAEQEAFINAAKEMLDNLNKASKLLDDVKTCEAKIKQIDGTLKGLRKTKNRLNEELTKATDLIDVERNMLSIKAQMTKLENDRQLKIQSNSFMAEGLRKQIYSANETEKRNLMLEADINTLERLVADKNIRDLDKHIYDLEQARANVIRNKVTLENQIESLKLQLEDGLVCPVCKSQLHLHGHSLDPYDDKALRLELDEASKEVKRLTQSDTDFDKSIGRARHRLQEYKDNIQRLSSLKEELSSNLRIVERLPDLNSQLVDIEKSTESLYLTYDSQIKILKDSYNEIASKFVEGKTRPIKDITGELEDVEDSIASYTAESSNYQNTIEKHKKYKQDIQHWNDILKEHLKTAEGFEFWVRGFGELRRISIEAFLPEFQSYTNHLLNLIESGLSIQLSTVRSRKKGGDPIEDFTINVCSPEGKVRSFNTFSQGEKRRIASCMALSIKHLSQNKGYQSFEFTLFDEVVDGLDASGIDEFFKLLDYVPGLDLVISHSSELNTRFNHRLHIIRGADKTEILQ